jgi:hypothetical protein
MTTPDFRTLCAELLQPLAEYDGANPYHEHRALITRARAALAEPVGEGPSESNVAELFYRHMGEGSEVGFENAIAEALARWGHPTPPAPEPGEVPAAWLYKGDPDFDGTTWRENWRVTTDEQLARFKAGPGCPVPLFRRAATLLQQLSASAPVVVPVPVSERLPVEGDCDAEGRCWLFSKVESEWRLLNVANPGVPHLKYCFSHWLPAHAIPLPKAGEVGQ